MFLGALNSAAHLDKVRGCVDRARAEGAVVQCGYTKDQLQLLPHNERVLRFSASH